MTKDPKTSPLSEASTPIMNNGYAIRPPVGSATMNADWQGGCVNVQKTLSL